jgi:hypothetical protein
VGTVVVTHVHSSLISFVIVVVAAEARHQPSDVNLPGRDVTT